MKILHYSLSWINAMVQFRKEKKKKAIMRIYTEVYLLEKLKR